MSQFIELAPLASGLISTLRPNEDQQSNLSPEDGAKLWKEHIEPKRSLGYKTCSPATSSNPNGFVWVADMLTACDGGCTVRQVNRDMSYMT